MRQFWFTLMLALSVAFGATANAWAAQDCPYKQPDVGQSLHDCCPENAPTSGDPAEDRSKMADCQLGQACRAAPAVEPELAEMPQTAAFAAAPASPGDQSGARANLLSGLWRPPRAL